MRKGGEPEEEEVSLGEEDEQHVAFLIIDLFIFSPCRLLSCTASSGSSRPSDIGCSAHWITGTVPNRVLHPTTYRKIGPPPLLYQGQSQTRRFNRCSLFLESF